MFQAPSTTTFVAPADPINVNQRYLVKVVDLIDRGIAKWPADNATLPNPVHRIRWVFRMANQDGTPVLDLDGNAYEHFDGTSSKTSKGKTRTATSRLWMEALLGPLEDHEVANPNITQRLKGKVAVALFEEVDSIGQDGTEVYSRIRILRLSPYNKSAAATAVTEQKEAATKAAATVAAARTAVAEPDDLAF